MEQQLVFMGFYPKIPSAVILFQTCITLFAEHKKIFCTMPRFGEGSIIMSKIPKSTLKPHALNYKTFKAIQMFYMRNRQQ